MVKTDLRPQAGRLALILKLNPSHFLAFSSESPKPQLFSTSRRRGLVDLIGQTGRTFLLQLLIVRDRRRTSCRTEGQAASTGSTSLFLWGYKSSISPPCPLSLKRPHSLYERVSAPLQLFYRRRHNNATTRTAEGFSRVFEPFLSVYFSSSTLPIDAG